MSNGGNDDRSTYAYATDRHGSQRMMAPDAMRTLRIVSDGTDDGTRVVDAETGEPVDGVTQVVLRLAAGEPAEAIIHLHDPEIDVDLTADPKPVKGKVKGKR